MKSGSNIQYEPCIFRRPLLPEDVPTFVTIQTVPCTSLHGIGANKVMVSGHLPLAVTVQTCLSGYKLTVACYQYSKLHLAKSQFIPYNSEQ